MGLYDELKSEVEAIQQKIVGAKKSKRTNALKKNKSLCKELGFAVGLLKGSFAEGRRKG